MVVQSNNLDDLLQSVPIHADVKDQIATNFWLSNCSGDTADLELYFKYYTAQSDLALHDLGRYVSVRTHRDVIVIVNLLKRGVTRDEVKRQLHAQNINASTTISDDVLDASIDLCVRLLLMLKVGHVHHGFSGHRELLWDHGSLQHFVASHFNAAQALNREQVQLEKVFVARNFGRIARIGIIWTDNLADHLRLLEHDTQVAIFHHATFLDAAKECPVFPPGLIEETSRSLALLFPQSERDTRRWFKGKASRGLLDTKAVQCGHLRAEDRHINAFNFWRDRLVILKHVFDEAEPNTWSQWWYDRRKGVQRYPFLLAAMALAVTLFFGLIQCFEGALQVYKAYHPT